MKNSPGLLVCGRYSGLGDPGRLQGRRQKQAAKNSDEPFKLPTPNSRNVYGLQQFMEGMGA
jgi:hypothetical protein